MLNGVSTQLYLSSGRYRCSLSEGIARHVLKVATSSHSIPFKVRKSALQILQSYKDFKERWEKTKWNPTPMRSMWFDMTPLILDGLQDILESPWLIEDFDYSSAETEEIKSLMEVTLKWNNGKIQPFMDIANATIGDGFSNIGQDGEEEMQKEFEIWRDKLEQHFPELNEEEQYEQFVQCIKSARLHLRVLMMEYHRSRVTKSNTFWFDKDGPDAYDKYL